MGWNLTYQHGWDGLNTVGYSNLNNYQIIIDQRQSLSSGSSGSYNSSDQAAFESWMATSGNYLWIKQAGDIGCCQNQRETETSNFISALGGGITFTGSNGTGDVASTFAEDSFYYGLSGLVHDTAATAGYITSATNGQLLWCPSTNNCTGAYYRAQDLEAGTVADFFTWQDQNSIGGEGIYWNKGDNEDIGTWLLNRASGAASAATSTYNLYEDQVTIAGIIQKDSNFTSINTSKKVYAFAVNPRENFAPTGTANDYFYPNFINTSAWSYGDVGLDYCASQGNNSTACQTYDNNYDFHTQSLYGGYIYSDRFDDTYQRVPEGMSLWWQVLNPNGVGVGLWAQISIKDSYDGASGSTTRDDQQSLLNVVISNIDYRKNDTTRYSVGDTGHGMDGYHYWSYQGATNADNNGLGLVYGTSPIECATSHDSGCFFGYESSYPKGLMLTSSDPYKSGSMTLGVNYDTNNDSFSTGSFNQAITFQFISDNNTAEQSQTLSEFRHSDFYSSSASSYSGFFSGILEFDVSGTGNSQLASIRSHCACLSLVYPSNYPLASFTFDSTNDDVQVVAPMTVYNLGGGTGGFGGGSNHYTANWTTIDTGSITLKFGDATNDEAKSAYISSEVFAAEIQDDGAQIGTNPDPGTSGGSNNLAGVMVSYNTLDNKDSTLFGTSNFTDMPDTAYSTWGFWSMSAIDISPNTGSQNASVHLGTWVGGETLADNEIPTSGSASMTGSAVFNVAYRYNQTGTNYDVHKYTTAGDVAASFSWGTSGYSGTLNFTNFDTSNPILSNAGFAGFVVAITGTDHTYSGNSTTSLENNWLGGASVVGALYGGSSPDESGGRVSVNLYKSGDIGTAGANDFYMAEGIYLVD